MMTPDEHDLERSPADSSGSDPLQPAQVSASERTTRITYGPSGEPEWIGAYRVVQQVGRGGMGVVYEAEQSEPVRRRVALKLMKHGLESREAVARFEAERQALALMNHPHIARVFDAGTTEQGWPFFVMEFVQGAPITTYCDRRRLTTQERLDLFVQVCEAVQHAHQKGIIHRDLKPSNVLVSDQEGKPLPKIIDFGVAKAMSQRLTDKTLYTQVGMFVGTPEYSSPEQAELSGDVDTRADVYSLGMLLYELLVGALPFDAQQFRQAGPAEMLRVIREQEPSRPSTRVTTLGEAAERAQRRRTDPTTLRRQLRGDLDWIVLKALEKDRGRRYASALDLAADIVRHARHEPVVAGPQSAGYRLGKFVRRHRAGVSFGGLLLVLLVGFGVTMAALAGQKARERDRANLEAVRANREAQAASAVTDFLVSLFSVSDPRESRGAEITARELLDRGAERIDRELRDEPLLRARMMETMGRVYRNLALYDQAAESLKRVVALQRNALGESHPDYARNLSFLGWVENWRKNTERALELVKDALAIQERVLPADHIDLAWTLYYLASCQIGRGCVLEAREELVRARDIFEKKLGKDHYVMGWCWNDIGLSYFNAGSYGPAQEAFGNALDVQRNHLPPDHPDLATHLINLAEVLLATGDHERAEPFIEEATRVSEGVFPPDHPMFAFCLRCRGDLLLSRGQLDDARTCFERALDIQRKTWGESSDEFGRTLRSQADLAWAQGDLARADSLYRTAWRILERAHPLGHIYGVETLESHARLLQALERSDEAAARTEEARIEHEKLTQPKPGCN